MNDRDEQAAEDVLDRSIEALRMRSIPEGPSPELTASTVEALRSQAPPEPVRLERKSLMVRIARYGSLAASVEACLALGIWLAVIGATAPVAFADVIEKVKEADSVSFIARQRVGKQPEMATKMHLQGDRMRYEIPGSMILIVDVERKEAIQLNPKEKIATRIDLQGRVPDEVLKNPIQQLRTLTGDKARRLADEPLEGRMHHVFEIKMEEEVLGVQGGRWKIWVDPRSRFPARMKVGEDRMSLVFDEFEWNKPADPELFSLRAPEGYRAVK